MYAGKPQMSSCEPATAKIRQFAKRSWQTTFDSCGDCRLRPSHTGYMAQGVGKEEGRPKYVSGLDVPKSQMRQLRQIRKFHIVLGFDARSTLFPLYNNIPIYISFRWLWASLRTLQDILIAHIAVVILRTDFVSESGKSDHLLHTQTHNRSLTLPPTTHLLRTVLWVASLRYGRAGVEFDIGKSCRVVIGSAFSV